MRMRKEPVHEPGIEGLRIAIIAQAMMDYERSSRYTSNHGSEDGERFWAEEALKKDCEMFFVSPWFHTICDIDGIALLDFIRKGVE